MSCKPAFHGTLLCLIGMGLGGCAATETLGSAARGGYLPTKVIVSEAPMEIEPARLQAVLAPDIRRPLPVSDEAIAHGVRHAQEHAAAAMREALGAQAGITLARPAPDEQAAVDAIPPAEVPSQADADRIRRGSGADALLRFRITDYGLTPIAWRKGYIAFEVTTTLALAAAIAYSKIPAAKAAAGAYVAQEAVEETAEAYAGFRGLDIIARPVRMEAELIRLKPVATVWRTSDTGLSRFKWSRLTRTVAPSERNAQLDQATDHAANEIASELSHAVRNRR